MLSQRVLVLFTVQLTSFRICSKNDANLASTPQDTAGWSDRSTEAGWSDGKKVSSEKTRKVSKSDQKWSLEELKSVTVQ